MTWAAVGTLGGLAIGGYSAYNAARRGGGGGGGSGFNIDDWLSRYSYMPRHTGELEDWGWGLTQRLTGQGGYGVNDIPFDLGLPTTGLYDALTRGIREQYLGTEGGPQSGRINDIFAQANQFGIPEYGLNQSRLANQDLNNSLLDVAARLNENEKNRLFNILTLGTNLGSGLYGQNLQQHRANAGLALQGAQFDARLADLIQQQNQSNISSLLGGIGGIVGGMYGGPMGYAAGSMAGNYLGNQFGGTNTSRSGNYYTGLNGGSIPRMNANERFYF